MKPVISPLKLGDHDADVTNLQDALLLLIDKGKLQFSSAAERQSYINGLSQEQHDQAYKDDTAQAIILFQGQQLFEHNSEAALESYVKLHLISRT